MHVNSSPRIQESDESYSAVFPHEARIRNLTYSTEIYVDVKLQKLKLVPVEKTIFTEGDKKEFIEKYEEGSAQTV